VAQNKSDFLFAKSDSGINGENKSTWIIVCYFRIPNRGGLSETENTVDERTDIYSYHLKGIICGD
jgi:hypothetical protein